MNARQYLQICHFIMPLAAASALAACGIDLESYGEPFFDLAARDSGVADAAPNQPMETAGSSAGGSAAGSDAPVKNDADGGKRSDDADAGEPEDPQVDGGQAVAAGSGGHAGAGSGGHAAGSGGHAAGSGGHAAGSGGAAGTAGYAGAGGSAAAAVSFSDIYTEIMASGCSCHNGGAGGLDLATRNIAYANLVGVASTSCLGEQRVVPGDAEASVLFHALSHSALGLCDVPTMPRNGAQLSAAQITRLQAWIGAGARDD